MNSNAASALSFALSKASAFLFQGKIWVPSPNGSAPVPQKLCQYAQAKRSHSFRGFPATTFFSSYQR